MHVTKTRLLLAALIAFVCAFALTTSTAAQNEPVTETQQQATPAPGAEAAVKPLRNGCAKLYSVKYHKSYTSSVYKRNSITKMARSKISRLTRCQRTGKLERKAKKFITKQQAARQFRATAYCGTPACNRNLGRAMAARRGWGDGQFSCLDHLWGVKESGWKVDADNPNSDAYGIPQALPGSKMGPGWQTSAVVQISWGLSYIAGRFGNPCGALAHSNRVGWY